MISIDKVTINIGVGAAGEKMEKAKKLIEKLSDQKAVEIKTKKRIPTWGVRKGLAIGTKTTLRGKKAEEFLNKALDSVERRINEKSFDKTGNFAFGIREYIDIPGFKYDPDIGMLGMDVAVTLNKWGYRITKRKVKRSRIPLKHRITKEDSINYAKEKLKIEVFN